VTSGDYFVGIIASDVGSHWLPLADLLGLDGRWGGFPGDPNEVGPLGAFLMVYGFARTGWRRLLFVAGGAMILLLADSRAAYAAASVGLIALVLLPGWSSRWRRITPTRAVAAGFAVLTGLRMASDLATNPASTLSLTGRSTMWPEFLSLWPQSPMFGVGTAEILDAVRSGVLPPWASTGHNQYIDTLVRYGVVGLALSTGLLLLAVAVAVGAVRRGSGVGLALLVVIIAASATNLLLDWRYPSAVLSAVLIAVALSSRPQRLLAASSSVATSTTSTPTA
jgi:O-antigen ligase